MKLRSQIRKITNKIHKKMKKLKHVRLRKIRNSVISRLLKVLKKTLILKKMKTNKPIMLNINQYVAEAKEGFGI